MPSFPSKFLIINGIFSTNFHHHNQIIMYIIPRTISSHQTSFSITYTIICTSLTNMEPFPPPHPTTLSHSGQITHFSLAFPLLWKLFPLSFLSHSATPITFPLIFIIFLMQYISDFNHQLNSNPQILSPCFHLTNTVKIPKISFLPAPHVPNPAGLQSYPHFQSCYPMCIIHT